VYGRLCGRDKDLSWICSAGMTRGVTRVHLMFASYGGIDSMVEIKGFPKNHMK
jgi:hypothetical protein